MGRLEDGRTGQQDHGAGAIVIWLAVGLPLVVVAATYIYALGVAAGKKRQSEIDELEFEKRLAEERKRGIR